MTLLFCTLALLAIWAAVSQPGGRLWRWLIAAPAAWLSALRPGQVLVLAVLLIVAPLMAQLAMADMAMVLAIDLAGWIEVSVAVLVVTRLAPGWKVLRGALARRLRLAAARRVWRLPRLTGRQARRRPAPRPRGGSTSDDGPAWAFA